MSIGGVDLTWMPRYGKFLSRSFTALNLLPFDRSARCRKQTHRPAELDEPGTKLLDGAAVILTQVRNGLTDRAATSPRRFFQLRVPAGYHCSLAPQIRSCW